MTGIHLNTYRTDKKDGEYFGFDADLGDMVAYKGKVITLSEYKLKTQKHGTRNKAKLHRNV